MATYTIGTPNGVNWTYLDLDINPNVIGSPVAVSDVWNISSFGLNIAPRSSGNGNITFYIWNSGGVAIWNSASVDIAPVDNGPGIGLESITVNTILTTGTYYFGFSRSNLSSMQWDNEGTTSGISWEGDSVGGNLTRVGSGQSGRRLCGSVTYTVINAPDAPTSPSASGGTRAASFSWTAPASNGGNAVAGYNVYRNDVYVGATTSTSWSDTGLSDNTSYNYKVSAYNSYKTSGTTTNVSATTFNVPGAPTGLSATGGVNSVALSWTAPVSNGGTAITSYSLYRGTTLVSSSITTTSYTNTGLAANTSYSYTVYANNAVGTSSVSGTASATTFNVPGVPTSFTASAGISTALLSWAAPASNGGSAITSYTLRRGTTQIYSGTATSFTDSGLALNTSYTYTVSATNAVGTGTTASASSTTLGGYVRVSTNGINWTSNQIPRIWNGTAWVQGSTRVWNGTSWVYGL